MTIGNFVLDVKGRLEKGKRGFRVRRNPNPTRHYFVLDVWLTKEYNTLTKKEIKKSERRKKVLSEVLQESLVKNSISADAILNIQVVAGEGRTLNGFFVNVKIDHFECSYQYRSA